MTDDSGRLRILVWHVHGSWLTSFVQGRHEFLVPRLPDRGSWGLGRAGRDWPATVREVSPEELATERVDVVVLQRLGEIERAHRWLGRRPGRDVPALYVEHNTPNGHAVNTRHPLAEQTAITLVHVTPFNELVWDNGRCPTAVVGHGVVDPGPGYTGDLPRVATMINEPVRRGRITGTDLLAGFAEVAPIDVFGIGTDRLGDRDPVRGGGDLDQRSLHREVARRRAYLHTARWTSLGLSLIEAMHLGMPVVCVGATEAAHAVPPEAGVVATDLEVLRAGLGRFMEDRELAVSAGKAAREFALANFGLDTFVSRWDALLAEAAR